MKQLSGAKAPGPLLLLWAGVLVTILMMAGPAPAEPQKMKTLIPPGHKFASLEPAAPHTIARTQKPAGYPERLHPCPPDWPSAGSDYAPPHFTDPKVLAGPEWADPDDFERALAARGGMFDSYEELPLVDGRPKNPRGPTGLAGRGLLGRFGPNFAADPIVFRQHDGRLHMIAIRRRDNGRWAIPGGMVDHGEKVSGTLARELAEEALGKELDPERARRFESTFAELFASEAVLVYQGYVDDFRNTDDAHMQTSAYLLLLRPEHAQTLDWDLTLDAGDDASEAIWMPLTAANLKEMHANHSDLVGRAVQLFQEREGKVVFEDGSVGKDGGR